MGAAAQVQLLRQAFNFLPVSFYLDMMKSSMQILSIH